MTIPDRLKHLPRDRRGFIIPWVVYRDPAGDPHFTINDFILYGRCLDQHLCPTCGQPLFRGRWFVGGPGSAFDPNGMYSDPPMHVECMHYAMTTCPFLAAPRYAHRIDDATLNKGDAAILFHDNAVTDERPALFVAVMATNGQERTTTPGGDYVRPKRPYARVEFWRHGQQLREAEALALFDEEMIGYYRDVMGERRKR